MKKLERAIAQGVARLGGAVACNQLKILFAMSVDGAPPSFGLPTASIGNGVAAVLVATQFVAEFHPIAPSGGDPFTDVTLRQSRMPHVDHFRPTILTPHATVGELNLKARADFIAVRLTHPDPISAYVSFLDFDWSLDVPDEVIVRRRRADACPTP